jgi:hypothetical protein
MEQKCGLQRSFKISSVVSEPAWTERRTTVWQAMCISQMKTKNGRTHFANNAVLARSPRHGVPCQSEEFVKEKTYKLRLYHSARPLRP